MRKLHRWLAVLFGVFLLWIALTGLGTHLLVIQLESERGVPPALVSEARAHDGEVHEEPATPASLAAAGVACPEGFTCRPIEPPSETAQGLDFVRHLHSGEGFGPLGTALSILSGLALAFFAVSGMWMYWRMWFGRKGKGLFWN